MSPHRDSHATRFLTTTRRYGTKAPVDPLSEQRRQLYSGTNVARELGYHDTSKYWERKV